MLDARRVDALSHVYSRSDRHPRSPSSPPSSDLTTLRRAPVSRDEGDNCRLDSRRTAARRDRWRRRSSTERPVYSFARSTVSSIAPDQSRRPLARRCPKRDEPSDDRSARNSSRVRWLRRTRAERDRIEALQTAGEYFIGPRTHRALQRDGDCDRVCFRRGSRGISPRDTRGGRKGDAARISMSARVPEAASHADDGWLLAAQARTNYKAF